MCVCVYVQQSKACILSDGKISNSLGSRSPGVGDKIRTPIPLQLFHIALEFLLMELNKRKTIRLVSIGKGEANFVDNIIVYLKKTTKKSMEMYDKP